MSCVDFGWCNIIILDRNRVSTFYSFSHEFYGIFGHLAFQDLGGDEKNVIKYSVGASENSEYSKMGDGSYWEPNDFSWLSDHAPCISVDGSKVSSLIDCPFPNFTIQQICSDRCCVGAWRFLRNAENEI
jgi:hypothetical protein